LLPHIERQATRKVFQRCAHGYQVRPLRVQPRKQFVWSHGDDFQMREDGTSYPGEPTFR
jgi:hypothetical protein